MVGDIVDITVVVKAGLQDNKDYQKCLGDKNDTVEPGVLLGPDSREK